MKKQSFILGTVVLTIASFLSKIIGAIYRIPLTNILGAEGLGLYQLIFPLYSTILVFCSTGVPNAIAKIIATGDERDSKRVIKLSLLFFTGLSIIFAVLLMVFSKFIANLQGNNQVAIVYLGIAPSIIFVGILSVFRGFFQGKQNIMPTSISMIVEQVFKLIMGLLFAQMLIPKGVMYGALGAVLGVTVSEFVALCVIVIEYIFYNKKYSVYKSKISSKEITIKGILKTALPITFSSMIMPLTILIDSFLIVNLLKSINFTTSQATNLYGILTGVVNSLINLPVVLSLSIATMVIPIVSKLYKNQNYVEVKQKTSFAFQLVLLIVIPCFFVFCFFPNDIITFLFKNGLKIGEINEFDVASILLRIGSISIIFIALVQISTTILQSINLSKIPMLNMLLCCLVKVLLTITLVLMPNLNIYGAIISSVVCYGLCALLNVTMLNKKFKITLSVKYDIFLPILASIMMLTAMQTIKFILKHGVVLVPTMLICGGVIYCLVYAIMSYGEKYDWHTLGKYLLKFKKSN